MLDIAILGGTVVTDTGTFNADIGIEGDTITLVAETGGLPPSRREINAEGCLILPGAIDIHFHVRAPSHPQRGTFVSETRAAAAGGVTTVLEMPISDPCCDNVEVFESRKALGEAESLVNFGLYGAPGLLNRDEVLGMADAGACGFKIFTHAIPAGRESEFGGLCLEDESELYRVLEMVKETGRLTSFHAENERLIKLFGERIRRTGRTDPAAFVESRPPVVESMAVAELAVLCGELDTHVHIAHVSCAAALEVLQIAQAKGSAHDRRDLPSLSLLHCGRHGQARPLCHDQTTAAHQSRSRRALGRSARRLPRGHHHRPQPLHPPREGSRP